MILEDVDGDYIKIPKSSWVKKRLRKHGLYGEHLSAAKSVLRFHKEEARLIEKYIGKAVNSFKEEWLGPSSDEEGSVQLIRKRPRRRDEEMNNE